MNNKSLLDAFASLKEHVSSASEKSEGRFKDVLKLEVGKTYTVRLLLNTKSPKDTVFHYYFRGWKSVVDGKYRSFLSPLTFGQPDPIDVEFWKLFKGDNAELKKLAKECINRKENWYVNCYVIDDPTHPENNGTVKILKMGAKIYDKYNAAINGTDAEDFGPRIFDLSENGCNLKIEVTKNDGGFASYEMSRFTMPRKIDGMTVEKMQEVYSQMHDLTAIEPVRTEEELIEALNVHFYGNVSKASKDLKKEDTKKSQSAPKTEEKKESPSESDVAVESTQKTSSQKHSSNNDDIDSFLDSLKS